MRVRQNSPAYSLYHYLGFGYEEFIMAKYDAVKLRPHLQALARELMIEERKQIIEAFKFGFDCGGKTEDVDTLANLYFQVRYNGQEKYLSKEAWYAEDIRNAT